MTIFKTGFVVAMAVISIAAYAQGKDSMQEMHSSMHDSMMSKTNAEEVSQLLTGGDRYDFEVMLSRMPSNYEHSLIKGLMSCNPKAKEMEMKMAAPESKMMMSDDMHMKKTMMMHSDINEQNVVSMLSADLTRTEAGQIRRFWDTASIGEKALVVAIVKKACMHGM